MKRYHARVFMKRSPLRSNTTEKLHPSVQQRLPVFIKFIANAMHQRPVAMLEEEIPARVSSRSMIECKIQRIFSDLGRDVNRGEA